MFGSEFQKYALSSLQQLLADHPPAPEGLDPDIGTAGSKYSHIRCLCFHLHLNTKMLQVEQVCVDVRRYPYFVGGDDLMVPATSGGLHNCTTLCIIAVTCERLCFKVGTH